MHTYPNISPQEYYDAIRAGNPIHFDMYFSNQGVTITEENINIDYGVTITDIMNGDNDLIVGKAVCQQFQARIILNDNLRYIKWKDRFRVRFGVEIEGDTKWITVGLGVIVIVEGLLLSTIIPLAWHWKEKKGNEKVDKVDKA